MVVNRRGDTEFWDSALYTYKKIKQAWFKFGQSYVRLQHMVENLQLWRNGRSHLEEYLANMVPNPRIFTTISNFLNIF